MHLTMHKLLVIMIKDIWSYSKTYDCPNNASFIALAKHITPFILA